MKAQRVHHSAALEENPLQLDDIPTPEPTAGQVLVKVRACGVCHTDLHLIEGDLPEAHLPMTPGHEVVGVVEACGEGCEVLSPGDRVGVFWLHAACGACDFCMRGEENLCHLARWTGYTAQGGYAEYLTVPEAYAIPIPAAFDDAHAAPLLCAGVVGYRSLRLSEVQPGEHLGLYGFGASAHLMIQVAQHWGCEVSVFTRSEDHKQHARDLGAVWVGEAQDTPPTPLDRGVIFAPAGWIVHEALKDLRRGGTLALNAIHMSDIPELPYNLLWHERTLRSVANVTRQDAQDFLTLAAEIGIRPDVTTYPLEDAPQALADMKHSRIDGAAVLTI